MPFAPQLMKIKFTPRICILLAFILCQSCHFPVEKRIVRGHDNFNLDRELVEDCKAVSPSGNQQVSAYVSSGNQKIDEGDFNSAVEYFTLAIGVDPGFYYAYFMRALAYRKLGQPVRAIDDYKKVEEFGPSAIVRDGCLFDNMAIAYSDLGAFHIAIAYHDKALKLAPSNPFIISNRGSTRMAMRNYGGAVEDFSKSLELRPQGNPALLNIGTALSLDGRYRESIEYFDLAIESYQRPRDYVMRGLAYVNLEEVGKACEDLRFALKNGESKISNFVDSYCD